MKSIDDAIRLSDELAMRLEGTFFSKDLAEIAWWLKDYKRLVAGRTNPKKVIIEAVMCKNCKWAIMPETLDPRYYRICDLEHRVVDITDYCNYGILSEELPQINDEEEPQK